jgi:3',5'-cyclic AMP phosphodiesterase CpdA
MVTRLFHVSDLHFGRADAAALDWFAAAVAAERPDAVIVTGDLTMRARSREFAAAAEWLSGLGVPLSIEPGNHDLPYFNPIARLFTPYRRFGKIESEVERPLDLPGLWLVPLRTTSRAQWRFNWAEGVVSRSSLIQAQERIVRTPPGSIAVVACHHPLVQRENSRARVSTLRGAEAIEILAKAGATAVLSGHVHDPFDVRWEMPTGAIRMIGAGTLSERLRTSPPSFNMLTIADGTLHVVPRTMG